MFDALEARTLALALLGLPLTLLVVMPPSIFLMFAWRPLPHVVPTAGTACFLAFVSFALAGMVGPSVERPVE